MQDLSGRERKVLLIITTASPCAKTGSIKGLNLQKKTQRDPDSGYCIGPKEMPVATGRDACCY